MKEHEEEFNTREAPHQPIQIVYDGTIGSYSKIMNITKGGLGAMGFKIDPGNIYIPTVSGHQELKEGDTVCLKPDGNITIIKKQ